MRMAGAPDADRELDAPCIDDRIGWQPIELPRLRAASAPADRSTLREQADDALVTVTWNWGHGLAPGAGLRQGAARPEVPETAFVTIGRTGFRAAGRRRVPLGLRPPPTANDNENAPGTTTGRKDGRARFKAVARDVFFLIVLAVTLYAAYESGRFAAYQKIIVVPESALPRGRVTRLVPASRASAPVAGTAAIG